MGAERWGRGMGNSREGICDKPGSGIHPVWQNCTVNITVIILYFVASKGPKETGVA